MRHCTQQRNFLRYGLDLIFVDDAVDCPVKVSAWSMGLCGCLGHVTVQRSHFIKTMGNARRRITASPLSLNHSVAPRFVDNAHGDPKNLHA